MDNRRSASYTSADGLPTLVDVVVPGDEAHRRGLRFPDTEAAGPAAAAGAADADTTTGAHGAGPRHADTTTEALPPTPPHDPGESSDAERYLAEQLRRSLAANLPDALVRAARRRDDDPGTD